MARITTPGWLPFMLAISLAACSRAPEAPDPAAPGAPPPADSSGETTVEPPPAMDESFDQSWQGVLPCADCDGIQTRLRLVSDEDGRRFELEETYLGAQGDNVFTVSGEWQVAEGEGGLPVYQLGVEGGAQRFERQADGSLQLLRAEPSPDQAAAYRLHRL